MSYWVYENTIHHKTRIHVATCSFCKDGQGLRGKGSTSSGAWFGPVQTLQEAEGLARSRGQVDNRCCQECLPNDSTDVEAVVADLPDNGSSDADERWDWDEEEQLRCSLDLCWKPIGRVTLGNDGKLVFPAVSASPGIYRFRVRTVAAAEANYVGESDNVRRRFGNYRNPGPTQATSLRINRFLRDSLTAGCEISVAISDAVWIETTKGKALADMSRASLRRVFENLALAVEQVSEIESLNR